MGFFIEQNMGTHLFGSPCIYEIFVDLIECNISRNNHNR